MGGGVSCEGEGGVGVHGRDGGGVRVGEVEGRAWEGVWMTHQGIPAVSPGQCHEGFHCTAHDDGAGRGVWSTRTTDTRRRQSIALREYLHASSVIM